MPELVMLGFPDETIFKKNDGIISFYACRPCPGLVATMFLGLGNNLRVEIAHDLPDLSLYLATAHCWDRYFNIRDPIIVDCPLMAYAVIYQLATEFQTVTPESDPPTGGNHECMALFRRPHQPYSKRSTLPRSRRLQNAGRGKLA